MQIIVREVIKKIYFSGCILVFLAYMAGNAFTAENRFIVLDDGTVKDQESGLIWAPQDNGKDISWSRAVLYCKNYSAGGHDDWRMPSADELATLYDNKQKIAEKDNDYAINITTKLIKISAPWVWTKRRTDERKSIVFGFNKGVSRRMYRSYAVNRRVLPVRTGKLLIPAKAEKP